MISIPLTRVESVATDVDKILSLFDISVQIYPTTLSWLNLYRRLSSDVSFVLGELSTACILIQSQPGGGFWDCKLFTIIVKGLEVGLNTFSIFNSNANFLDYNQILINKKPESKIKIVLPAYGS